jgi:hypothetical protein
MNEAEAESGWASAEPDPSNVGESGINILKKGQEPVIGPDEVYPDWLKVRSSRIILRR